MSTGTATRPRVTTRRLVVVGVLVSLFLALRRRDRDATAAADHDGER